MSNHRRDIAAIVLVLLTGACSDSSSSSAPDAPISLPAIDAPSAATPDSQPAPTPDARLPPDAPPPIGSCDKTEWTVTTPAFEYAFDGVRGSPAVLVCTGHTYTFHLDGVASEHPFCIWNANTRDDAPGVTNNCSTGTVDVTWRVPASLPSGVWYQCAVHMFGNFFVVQ